MDYDTLINGDSFLSSHAVVNTQFNQRKHEILHDLRKGLHDNSPRGHIDIPINDLVKIINGHDDFVTTSSCSGSTT